MRAVLAFLCVGVAVTYAARLRREEQYTNKYDNIDLDQILKSDRLLKNYMNCLLEKGKCTPDGAELKRVIPDALENNCSKCSETQRKGAEKVAKFLIKEKPEMYKELEAKYDPKGIYRKKYETEAADKGIVLPS